jgi:hypothetical protein
MVVEARREGICRVGTAKQLAPQALAEASASASSSVNPLLHNLLHSPQILHFHKMGNTRLEPRVSISQNVKLQQSHYFGRDPAELKMHELIMLPVLIQAYNIMVSFKYVINRPL